MRFTEKVDLLNSWVTLILILALMLVGWYCLTQHNSIEQQAKREYYNQYHLDHNL